MALLRQFPTPEAIAERFGCNIQPELMKYKSLGEVSTSSEYPAIGLVTATYGIEMSMLLLEVPLSNLNKFAGQTNGMTKEQISELAYILANENYWINIAEFHVFFIKFKGGIYGTFYGAIDPIKIGNAWKDFLKERSSAIARIESEENTKRVLREAEEAKKNAVSREEYEALEALPFYIYFTKSGEQYKSGICKKLGITFGADIKNEVFADIKKKDLSYLYKLEEDGYIQIFDKKPTNQERHNGKTWKKSTT